MKRSKVFLGITSCLLAIAGVAAAKAHHFTQTRGAYTSSNECISVGNRANATNTVKSNKVHTSSVSGAKTIYSFNGTQCTVPLWTTSAS